MTDFLLELRSEEIPARMQAGARDSLAKLFAAELARAGLAATETVTYATPRRLALIARGLPDATEAVREEVKGPRANAPEQALEGFLRKTGLTRDQLTERDGVLFAITEKPGRATAQVLAEAIPAIIRAFPWPKSMRWGDASRSTESLRWVRPLQGIVALFGETIVPVTIAGIESGAATLGHRFHHPGAITIGSAADYVEKLRACHVIVDQDERAAIIRDGAAQLARDAGLELIADEGLVAENAGLTEWPVPLLGRFDPTFLDVPPEVIQLTARVNQKYFVCRSADGKLADAFVCTANIAASDSGATIVEGNRKVLAARLADARFFYETDLKVPLEEQARKLEKIVFHEKLGTVADKVDRVAKLARWLVEEGVVGVFPSRLRASGTSGPRPEPNDAGHRSPDAGPGEGMSANAAPAVTSPPPTPPASGRGDLADLAERAARLAKADLVTGMVGEFPELQGVMGGYYAAAQGEHPAVVAAIRDHYKPVGQGDDVPTDPVTVAVSLADKLDTIVGFFSENMRPSGSKDPFALRRAAISVIRTIEKDNIRISLLNVAFMAFEPYKEIRFLNSTMTKLREIRSASRRLGLTAEDATRYRMQVMSAESGEVAAILRGLDDFYREFENFFADRLKVQQREAGVRHDLIDAVFTLGGEDDLVRLLARVRALQSFVDTEDGANLLAGYKRAANILKKEGYTVSAPTRHPGLVPGPTAPQAAASQEEDWTPEQVRGDEGGAAGPIPLSYTPEIAEADLVAALDAAEPAAARAVELEDFEAAMAALATLRAPIDAFFEQVTVNDPDADKRAARLALLARVRDAVHNVADFSKVEG